MVECGGWKRQSVRLLPLESCVDRETPFSPCLGAWPYSTRQAREHQQTAARKSAPLWILFR